MQFLPSIINAAGEAVSESGFGSKIQAAGDKSTVFAELLDSMGSSSDGELSSYISAGRTKYTGIPEGFSASDDASGTISSGKVEIFKNNLRKRNIDEASLDSLNQLMASGAPMTISRIFSTLTGQSRASAELDEAGRTQFSQLMQKLGFTKDESEEMLELSASGKTSDLLKSLNQKIGQLSSSLEDGVEVNAEEFLSLIQGLDLTEKTRASLLKMFGNNDSLVLNRESLQALMAEANNEIAAKDLAAKAVAKELRGAMTDALQDAKLAERTAQVSDARGSRYLQQSEALMQETITKKLDESGNSPTKVMEDRQTLADLAVRGNGSEAEGGLGEEGGATEEDGTPKNRADRVLQNTAAAKSEKNAEGAKSSGSEAKIFETLAQRIDMAAPAVSQAVSGHQGNLGAMAGFAASYRQEIFTQVETGILQNMTDGQQRLTLQLAPQELGQVTVILTVHNNELRASIRTDNQESAAALGEQLEALRTSLEEQGLKVAELDVQCHMQDNPAANQWNGESDHNLMHDAQERARMTRLNRLRRDEGTAIGSVLEQKNAPALSEAGLHIIA